MVVQAQRLTVHLCRSAGHDDVVVRKVVAWQAKPSAVQRYYSDCFEANLRCPVVVWQQSWAGSKSSRRSYDRTGAGAINERFPEVHSESYSSLWAPIACGED